MLCDRDILSTLYSLPHIILLTLPRGRYDHPHLTGKNPNLKAVITSKGPTVQHREIYSIFFNNLRRESQKEYMTESLCYYT